MIVFVFAIVLFCVVLPASMLVVRAVASTYPREVAPGRTEALEAWIDAFDAVLDPRSCTIEDVDAHIFEALAAADATMQHPHGSPSPACRCDKCNVRYTEAERELLEAERWGVRPPPKPLDARRSVMSADYEQKLDAQYPLQVYPLQVIEPVWEYGCPECHSMTPSPDMREFCSVCGYAPPPDGSDVDLSKWNAETQSFNRAAERAFGLPKNSLTGHHPDESPFTMPLMEEIDGKRDKRPKPQRPSPMKRSRF